jgi:hypothetical protein
MQTNKVCLLRLIVLLYSPIPVCVSQVGGLLLLFRLKYYIHCSFLNACYLLTNPIVVAYIILMTFGEPINSFINCIWNTEEFPYQWKESIIIPIYKKGDKTDSSNFRGISLLSTSYKMLSNVLLSRLSPYIDEIVGDYQCGLDITDQLLIKFFAFARF